MATNATPETKEHRIKQKWCDVFVLNQTVFNGLPPKELFEKRRPLESKDNYSLQYRLDNYHPVQTSLFKRANQQYIEVLNKSDVSITSGSESVTKFLAAFKKYENGRWFSLQQWLFNYIAEKRQLDPNGIVLVYPKVTFIENVPILPAASTFSPDVKIDYIQHDKIITINEDVIKVCLGQLDLGIKDEKGVQQSDLHDYFLIVNNKQYDIEYPAKQQDGTVTYTQIGFYEHKMNAIPFTHIGGSLLTETVQTIAGRGRQLSYETFDYYVSDFFGAIAFACYMITALSDKQVNIARHNFPIKYKMRQRCQAQGCHQTSGGIFQTYNDQNTLITCGGCGGTGWKKDTDTFGTIEYDPGNALDQQNIDLKSPVGYVAPPIDSLKFLHDDFIDYYTKVAQELCVNVKQNITNASAESKSYDVQTKVSLITYIVEDILRIAKDVYSFCEMLIDNKDTASVTIKKPQTWDIKTKEDILTQLVANKKDNVPYPILLELTKEYLNKELQDTYLSNWIIDIITRRDKLLAYGVIDMKDAKVTFGNDITNTDLMIHQQGLSILKKIVTSGIEITTPEQLEQLFNIEIAKSVPATTGL